MGLYEIDKSYLHNAEQGPFFTGEIPERDWPSLEKYVDFLGFKVASRIGVPAGPLLNERWIKLAGQLGYDLPVYKTIRSQPYPGHPVPNILCVKVEQPLDLSRSVYPAFDQRPINDTVGITNSFGMPSRDHDYLRKDIPAANQTLQSGQLMIVSVVGTPKAGGTFADLIQDYSEAAQFAKECGAKVVEANLSCPNVSREEGSIYTNPEAIYSITSTLYKALRGTPLVLKVGNYTDQNQLKRCLLSAAKGGAQGFSGFNSVSMRALDQSGLPLLGKGRETSGICGGPIRQMALDFIRQARTIIDLERLGLTLIGVGGIVRPEHFDDFFNAGADFAMTATGMMWDPFLAMKYHNQETLCTQIH